MAIFLIGINPKLFNNCTDHKLFGGLVVVTHLLKTLSPLLDASAVPAQSAAVVAAVAVRVR